MKRSEFRRWRLPLVVGALYCGQGMAWADAGDYTHTAAVTASGDNGSGHQLMLDLDLPVQERSWLHLTSGVTRNSAQDDGDPDTKDSAIEPVIGGVSFGGQTDRYAASLGYTRRQDGSTFQQNDFSANADWLMPHGKLGVDVFYRDSKSEQELFQSVHLAATEDYPDSGEAETQKVKGPGWGLHGEIDVAEPLTLKASYMKYDYSLHASIGDESLTKSAYLRSLLLTHFGLTASNRDEGSFDSSIGAGAAYRWRDETLSVDYYHDAVFDTDEKIDTALLSLAIPLAGGRYTVTPQFSYSTSDVGDDTVGGGLTVAMSW